MILFKITVGHGKFDLSVDAFALEASLNDTVYQLISGQVLSLHTRRANTP